MTEPDLTPPSASAHRTPPLANDRTRRRLLVLGVPALVFAIAIGIWFSGGRYVGTDNAYVKTSTAALSAEVSGPVSALYVRENEAVAKGQILFRIDPAPYALAHQSAKAALATLRADIEARKANYRQLAEQRAAAQEDVAYQQKAFDRQRTLAERKHVSVSTLDDFKHRLAQAQAGLRAIVQNMDALKAQLGGDPDIRVEDHPAYKEAVLREERAALDLAHTDVRAPMDGIVAKLPTQGEFVRAGMNVMSLVSSSHLWVEANMKETDLTYVAVGQTVNVHIDVYPDRTWQGRVLSISPATGAEFSILPPQNATGNWVKVVQRIPVRIALAPGPDAPVLRAGLSAEVEIDTGRSRSLGNIWRQLTASSAPNMHGAVSSAR